MDNRYYDNLIGEMQSFFDEQKFVLNEDGSYKNDSYAVKIDFDEERQMYQLHLADISEDKGAEYALLTSWLFDDSQNATDAGSVGIDFAETLREKLGCKVTRKANAKIDLPSAAKKDGNITIEGFTKKLLDIYLPLKDEYKQHIATFGNFLYLEFYSSAVVPLVKATLTENNKKAVKKLFDVFENAYVQGDRDTSNAAVAILSAVCYKDTALKDAVKNFLSEDSHFYSSVSSFVPVLEKNKKLTKVLVK